MRLSTRMAFAAFLLGSTFAMTSVAAHAASPGCPSATQKTEQEGGAGGGTQQYAQKTEQEGGAGGGTQQRYAQKTEQEGGAGGGTQQRYAQKTEQEGGAGGGTQQYTQRTAGTQQASAQPCK